MTTSQQLASLKAMSGEQDENVLLPYLDLAGEKILNKAYPFDPTVREVPLKYHGKQVEIALYLYNKRGAEGQTAHSENGISRSYESASVPDSMLRDVISHVGVFRSKTEG